MRTKLTRPPNEQHSKRQLKERALLTKENHHDSKNNCPCFQSYEHKNAHLSLSIDKGHGENCDEFADIWVWIDLRIVLLAAFGRFESPHGDDDKLGSRGKRRASV